MPPTMGATCLYSRAYKMPHVVYSRVYLSHDLHIHGASPWLDLCCIKLKMVYSIKGGF